ncbi:helix-turn-helix transcriptional regulator [Marivirga sp.]|uniref:helix-turn-helix transcriptional regulator n=1 Tax=Marivirga sp. TaxID=2018662 RepID=UPI003DA6E6BC
MQLPFNKKNSEYLYNLMDVGKRHINQCDTKAILHNLNNLINLYSNKFGPTYYSINDCSTGQYLYISENCQQITGYPQDYFYQFGLKGYHDFRAPENDKFLKEMIISSWNYAHKLPKNDRLNLITNFDYCIITGDHYKFKRILDQLITLSLDRDGKFRILLAISQEISHIKKPDPILLPGASIHLRRNGSHHLYNHFTQDFIDMDTLTEREHEILSCYGVGMNSGTIAESLFISPFTVQSHRTNLYKKTKCKNINQLKAFAQSIH